MVGRAGVFENRILVILGMRSGKVPAVEIEVVLLLAVVGQRIAARLTPADAAAVGERRQE